MKDILFPNPTLPKLSKLIFFLIIFFLPQQFGPHFWPDFSFVNGIRVDYLSPSVYLTDILIMILFIMSAKQVFANTQTVRFFGKKATFVFFTFLIIPLLYAASIPAILFGLLKTIEFLFLGLYATTTITKKDILTIIEVFVAAAVMQSILAILQFFTQGSLNGVFYFLGERYYSLSSIGIAAMNTAQGLLVRPYGTFPHPNVLAFYLFVSSVLLCFYISKLKKWKQKLIPVLSLLLIQSALFLTFSRTSLICNILFFSYVLLQFLVKKKRISRKTILLAVILIILLGMYVSTFNIRFLNFSNIWNDFMTRLALAAIGISAIKEYPLGLGLNNFYYYEAGKQLSFSATYLQPIHNIFLLLACTIGLSCTVLFAYFLGVILLTLRHSVKRGVGFTFPKALLILFLSVIFVGMFDHFFLTIQQGQLLFAIILGLSLNKKI